MPGSAADLLSDLGQVTLPLFLLALLVYVACELFGTETVTFYVYVQHLTIEPWSQLGCLNTSEISNNVVIKSLR